MYNISGAVKSNGLTATGSFEGKELEVQGVFNPEPSSITLGGVLRNILTILSTAAYAVIDLGGRVFWGSDASGVYDAVRSDTDAKVYTFTPTEGQTGRSLEWESSAGVGFDSASKTALDALIAPTVPAYTVEGLCAAIARTMPDGLKAAICVSQDDKEVNVVIQTAQAKTIKGLADAVAPAPTNLVKVELEDLPVTPGNSDLPFEGGTV